MHSDILSGTTAGTAGLMVPRLPNGCGDQELLNEVTQRPELTHRVAESILSKSHSAKELAFYSWTHLCTRTIKEDSDVQDSELDAHF